MLEETYVSEVWTSGSSCGQVLLRVFRMQGRPRGRKVPDGTVLQHDLSVVCCYQACRDVAGTSREEAKLGRPPGWNLVRAERSRLCIYAFLQRKCVDGGEDKQDDRQNKCDFSNCLRSILSVIRHGEYDRSPTKMELVLAPGESRGYWKYRTPEKWFKQAKVVVKINNKNATMLLDSGAEISIVDTAFARKVGCVIDENQKQECVGIVEITYMTEGRTKIKITLNGSLVYYFDVWVGDQVGQEMILGMDFVGPAGIRLYLADGTLVLPDEVRIHLAGRRPLYGSSMQPIVIPE